MQCHKAALYTGKIAGTCNNELIPVIPRLPVFFLAQFMELLFTFKALSSLSAKYLQDHFLPYETAQALK